MSQSSNTQRSSSARRLRASLARASAITLMIVGMLAGTSFAQTPVPPHPESDTIPSFNESVGCGPLNGVRGPQMGPGPYDDGYPYHDLPDDAALHGPWADLFGRDMGDVRDGLVAVNLPGLTKDLYIHERVLPAFNQVLTNLAIEAANGNVYEIRSDTWSFNNATVPPGRHLSFHSVGASIDVNSTTNPYRADNVLITDMPGWFVDAWRDAGWCWGGDWVSIKDPMHFAWMGPMATPGYGAEPTPYPPDTAASTFSAVTEVPNALQVTVPTAAHFVVDVDRDGSPDIARLQTSPQTGEFWLELAQSWRRFETCTATSRAPAPPITPTSFLMADHDADGRPEVWMFDESGSTVTIAIYSIVQQVGGSSAITGTPNLLDTLATTIPVVAGTTYLVGDHERDGTADLYVIDPGATTTVTVWGGPDYASVTLSQATSLATDTDWRFSLGDRDVDGIPDLYAVSDADPAALETAFGGSGFTTAAASLTTAVSPLASDTFAVEDYDGDGRDDLYLVNGDGDTRVFLGGNRAVDADLVGWFVKEDLSWGYGSGCSRPAMLRVTTDPPVPSQIRVDGTPVDTWGLTWLKLAPGDYTVSFSDVEGFSTPADESVTMAAGGTTTVTGSFTPRGHLRVSTDPPLPATISIDGVPRNDWGVWTDLGAGDYEVCFGDVADYSAPPCETATIEAGSTTDLVGTFAASPGALGPDGFGMLRVTTNPPLPSQILVDGVPADTWGLNWLKLPPGDYTVSFRDVGGYATPSPQEITIVAGETTTVEGAFTERGFLRVITDPAVVATVLVDGLPRNDWGVWTDLDPGGYEVCFGPASGFQTPPCQETNVTAGATTTITATYLSTGSP